MHAVDHDGGAGGVKMGGRPPRAPATGRPFVRSLGHPPRRYVNSPPRAAHQREIVLDTETTGFDPTEGRRIVEIGSVELVNRCPNGNTFHRYLCPQRAMPADAIAVHGLTGAFLADKPLFAAVADEFLVFVGDAPLVAHNAHWWSCPTLCHSPCLARFATAARHRPQPTARRQRAVLRAVRAPSSLWVPT